MTAVFGHGRLRLYLLGLLEDSPRHGYEMIRLLEDRFLGLYQPSAGTVYPRLARLAAQGLVTHAADGGRKVYALTGRGRAELDGRRDELAALDAEILAAVTRRAGAVPGQAGTAPDVPTGGGRSPVARPRRPGGTPSEREFGRAVDAFAARARELAARHPPSESRLAACRAVLDDALAGLARHLDGG